MELICYPLTTEKFEIEPAPVNRPWMDATPQGFAYRCLPLNIANMNGWQILCGTSFTAIWDGSDRLDAIQIMADDPRPAFMPLSHFGSGVLTFHVNGLFRTPPGVNLFVTGPINQPKDGIHALSGIVETDWAPYTFTMNWLFTRANHPVSFRKGEPFCQIFPLPRGLAENLDPVFRPMKEDPALKADYTTWLEARNQFNADLQKPGSDAQKEKWQKTYY
nr:DUF6065 family protein [Pseudomonadota bacterium]